MLSAHELTKNFGAFCAVDNATIEFREGEIHALMGENGAGKSTLLKLMFGMLTPSRGDVRLNGQLVPWKNPREAIRSGVGMVHQHFSLVESLSVLDNIILGDEPLNGLQVDRAFAIEKIEQALPNAHLRLDWTKKVVDLSVGEKQVVEILKLVYRKAQVLFLDEPTAVLTPHEIETLFEILRDFRKQGMTIVFVSHKIDEVFALCDSYTVIRKGKVTASGKINQTTPADLVKAMIGRDRAENKLEAQPAGECVLKVKDFWGEISFEVRAGEILGIAGVQGSGQRELVSEIIGLGDGRGEIFLNGKNVSNLDIGERRNLGISLVPEDRHKQGLWLDESVATNFILGIEGRFAKFGWLNLARAKDSIEAWAKAFDLRAPSFDISARSLSGGNQQKIILAREVLARQPKLLICHEPTRGVDVGAIDMIHRQILDLRQRGVAILLISSELTEVLSLSDRVLVLRDKKTSGVFATRPFDRMQVGAAMTGAR